MVRNGVWRTCAGRKIHHPLFVIKTNKKSKSAPSDVMRQNDGSNYGKLAVNSNKLNYYCLFIIFTETCALPRSITRVYCRDEFSPGLTIKISQ